MKKWLVMATVIFTGAGIAAAQNPSARELYAGSFKAGDKATVQRVSFKNQYQMEVIGNLFIDRKSVV